jgi:hypothetical protein
MNTAYHDDLDAGKRAADLVNFYLATMDWSTIRNSFLAIRLSDGGSDGILYDNKRDAVRHQIHEQQCAYVCFRNIAGGTNARDMLIFLQFNRKAYANGMRLVDPDDQFGGPDVAMTSARVDQMRGRVRNIIAPRMTR